MKKQMKNGSKGTKQVKAEFETKVEKKDTAAGAKVISEVMSTEKMAMLTTTTVAQLNQYTETEGDARFKRGEVIAKYMDDVNPSGKSNQKFYQALADNPSSVLKVQQIRYCHESWKLRCEMEADLKGTDTGTLKISHWVAVMPKMLDRNERATLLKRAVAESLSVKDLQSEVMKIIDAKRHESGKTKPIDMKSASVKFVDRAESLLSDLLSWNDKSGKTSDPKLAVYKTDIGSKIKSLVDFALQYGFLTKEQLNKSPSSRANDSEK